MSNLKILAKAMIVSSIIGYLLTIKSDFGLEKYDYANLIAMLAIFSLVTSFVSLVFVFKQTNKKDRIIFITSSVVCFILASLQFLGAAIINV